MIRKPDTVPLPQPSSSRQMLRPGSAEGRPHSCARPIFCQLHVSSYWLGPFISSELFGGWEERPLQQDSEKPTLLGEVPDDDWKAKNRNL